jgi:hypothetical protein
MNTSINSHSDKYWLKFSSLTDTSILNIQVVVSADVHIILITQVEVLSFFVMFTSCQSLKYCKFSEVMSNFIIFLFELDIENASVLFDTDCHKFIFF